MYQSKDKLEKIVIKRIRTTMIGALDSLERKFGYLWAHDEERELTPQESEFREMYEELRSEILDKGNNQIRIFQEDLKDFDVNWLRYHMVLPIRRG